MEKNTWKTISIILFILVLLETSILVWAWNVGTEDLESESVCAYDICELDSGVEYSAYYFDSYYDICYCYDNEGEIALTEYMTG